MVANRKERRSATANQNRDMNATVSKHPGHFNEVINLNTVRDILNKVTHTGGDLSNVDIYYLHRGVANNTASLNAATIAKIGKSFLYMPDGSGIPFHRVFRIEQTGKVIWERRKSKGD